MVIAWSLERPSLVFFASILSLVWVARFMPLPRLRQVAHRTGSRFKSASNSDSFMDMVAFVTLRLNNLSIGLSYNFVGCVGFCWVVYPTAMKPLLLGL